MANLKLFLFGPPQMVLEGQPVDIKRRKAMAMLIYLAVTGQAHSRDALATLFYPDHDQRRARAYLRRDLAVLNTSLERDWLETERDRVELEQAAGLWLDVGQFQQLLAQSQSHDHEAGTVCADCLSLLAEATKLYTDDFLAGFTLRDCPEFDDWQFFQAESLRQELATVLEWLVAGLCDQGEPETAIPHARRWVSLDPLHEPAQRRLIQLYDQSGQPAAALRQYEEFVKLLEEELGLPPAEETTTVYEAIKAKRMLEPYVRAAEQSKTKTPKAASLPKSTARGSTSVVASSGAPSSPSERVIAQQLGQEIRFCITPDKIRLAYATVGEGPVLVKAANWLSHLEYDWQSPVWRHWLSGLAQHHTLVRYDERGCGLSDWKVDDLSFEAWVRDLETVVDAVGLEQFPLLGISQGVAIAIAYAARHPEKVSQLILYGGYARGRLNRDLTPEQLEEAQTFMQLIKLGWGQENPAFRQVFTTLFMPDASLEQQQAFNELQRISTSPENAMRLVAGFDTVDVRHLAPQVAAPTLLLHARGDARIPFAESELIANLIPGARLVPLESRNHILLEDEPAWPQFLAEVHQFLGVETEGRSAPITSRSRPTPPPSMPLSSERSTPPHNLPAQPTEFIGRENELTEIRRLLVEEPGCRLLTLVGPGGIGKTRLALEAAGRALNAFRDGVYFVPLAPLQSAENIVSTIADSLDFQFAGPKEPKAQLLGYLRDKQRLLLILDNFEHLLAPPEEETTGGADLAAELLAAVPNLKMLVTSRQRLNLSGETVYTLSGLTYPDDWQRAAESDATGFSAVQLLLQRARQVQPDAEPTSQDLIQAVRICQLVEGMPLALVLAASWVEVISLQEIADEIEESLDFLETELRDLPERQRSVRVVFEASWKRLSLDEQEALMKLSVFRGGFTREAARTVAEANLPTLRNLANKSLLSLSGKGRYEMHELLRQFVEAQLSAVAREEARNRHSHYYLNLLQEQEKTLQSDRQPTVIAELMLEIDNLRAAWIWAVIQKQVTSLWQASWPQYYFYDLRNYYQEGEAVFHRAQEALQILADGDPDNTTVTATLGRITAFRAFHAMRLGQTQGALAWLRPFIGRLRDHRGELDMKMALMDVLWIYGLGCWFSGEFTEGLSLLQEALALSRELERPWHTAASLAFIGVILHEQGDYAQAYEVLYECLTISRQMDDPRAISFSISFLSRAAHALGQYEEMLVLLREGLALVQQAGDRVSIGLALEQMANGHYALGDIAEAHRYFQESLAIYREIDDAWSLSRILNTLGNIALAKNDLSEAEQQFIKAFRTAMETEFTANALDALAGLARSRARAGFDEVALELAELIVQHPGSTQAALEQAEQLGMEISDHLNPQKVESVQTNARNKTLEMVAIELGELAKGELIPLTVGQRFIQQDLIATGGMGQVYLGQDQETGRPVAIKRLKSELVQSNPEAVQRLVREGEILRQLNHPNIVKVLATVETEEQPSIVMEYVPGGSLQDLLEEGAPLPLEQALNIGLELADALARAHHLGIIHRDLKPANVLLAADGTPRLSDFGIAYLVQPESRLTQEGAILGTTVYMSPEAWRGEELDARSDIWSFGAVLYKMLAGQPPFAAEQPVAIMTAILNDPVPDLYQFRPEAPPGLVELITQMLAKERARRLESMRQVAAGLELIRQIK